MAIVQISRIQHRRGRKGTSDIPQLASGELGWAVDTQELYIGNGSVSEGAPAVGNTKVLTEHDDIFTYARLYSYKPTNNLWNATIPTTRTLQERLDDFVTVKSFGAVGDGLTDDTEAIQDAIYNLFLSAETQNKVTLIFPAGTYIISDTIKIPPYAIIKGAGKDKTIIKSSSATMFRTVNGTSTPGSDNNSATTSIFDINPNQARYIDISDITIEVDGLYTGIDLIDCANSKFHNIRFIGNWTSGNGTDAAIRAINFTSSSTVVTCRNNVFTQIEVDGFYHGVYSDYDIRDNSWKDSIFYMCRYGISFGEQSSIGIPGQDTGPLHNLIENCMFDMIDREGLKIINGEYNTSKNNRYHNVGNDGGSPAVAVSGNIALSGITNVSESDFFERTQYLVDNKWSSVSVYQKEYVPEVTGRTYYRNQYANTITIGQQLIQVELLKFPMVDYGTVYVDYVYIADTSGTGDNIVKEGTLELVCNKDYGIGTIIVNDNYTFVGPGIYSSAIQFVANYFDYNSDTIDDTIGLECTNTMPVATDNFVFTIRVKS
jgi:hypothetical protein